MCFVYFVKNNSLYVSDTEMFSVEINIQVPGFSCPLGSVGFSKCFRFSSSGFQVTKFVFLSQLLFHYGCRLDCSLNEKMASQVSQEMVYKAYRQNI